MDGRGRRDEPDELDEQSPDYEPTVLDPTQRAAELDDAATLIGVAPVKTAARQTAAVVFHDSSPATPGETPTIGATRAMPPVFAAGELAGGRYRVVRFVAAGGMGQVFEVTDRELGNERLALKTLNPSLAGHGVAANQFKSEIQLARKVTHPNVCRIFEFGYHTFPGRGVTAFLTMEMLDGETMRQRLRRGPMSSAEVRGIAAQLARGLAAAHAAGVVHRDFKSENVILVEAQDGAAPRAVITDFGVAIRANDGGTASGTTAMVGTPAYMAPELIDGGDATASADLYSFGVVLYEMLSGTLPFIGATPLATALARLDGPPPALTTLVPDIDETLVALVDACLLLDPELRGQRVLPLLRALTREDETTFAIRAAAPRLRRWSIALAIAALVALITVVLVVTQRHTSKTGAIAPPQPRHRITRRTLVRTFVDASGKIGNSTIAFGLRELLRAELSDAPGWRTLGPPAMARLQASRLYAPGQLDPVTAIRLADVSYSDQIVEGTYVVNADGHVSSTARLVDGTTGGTVATVHSTSADIRSVASDLGAQLRSALHFTRSSPVATGLWPTTSDAARSYGAALAADQSRDSSDILAKLRDVVSREPNFIPAWWVRCAASEFLTIPNDCEQSLVVTGLPVDDAQMLMLDEATISRNYNAALEIAKVMAAADPLDRRLEYWTASSPLASADETVANLRRFAAKATPWQRVELTANEVFVYDHFHQHEQVVAAVPACVRAATAVGDLRTVAQCAVMGATAAETAMRWDEAESLAASASMAAHAVGDLQIELGAMELRWRMLNKYGHQRTMETLAREEIVETRARGDERNARDAELALSGALLETGPIAECRKLLDEALIPYYLSGEGVRQGNYAQLVGANAALADGDVESAEHDALASLGYYLATNDDRLVAYARMVMAEVALAAGKLESAREEATQALQIRNAGHLTRVANQSKALLARIDLAADNAASAEAVLRDLLADPAAKLMKADRAELLAQRSLALVALGRTAEAAACIHQALPLIAGNDSLSLALLVGRAHAVVTAAARDRKAPKAAVAELVALRKRADAGGFVVEALQLRLAAARINAREGAVAAAVREAKAIAAVAKDLDLGLLNSQARALVATK